ncbi:hypothetical protein NHX12_020859 [Muraenolepis orangiensis]|uniref:Uncharacterized protein n=1 Tax=Muraenolepis orangiensis TaxID=630683 RepID=A0A9Q0ESR0_9TELE|nr:hypothetical protein NHX12_020859 [Muraenolepis orangiensis]
MRSVSLSLCAGLLFAVAVVAPEPPLNTHQRWDTNELLSPPPATTPGGGGGGGGGEGGGSCSLRLRPSGQCLGSGAEDQGGCPYQLTLPTLTIQLPEQFKMLERTVKELQSLKETVSELQSSCHECRGGGGAGGGVTSPGTTAGGGEPQHPKPHRQQQADQGRPSGAGGAGQRPGSDPQEQQRLPESSREETGDGCVDGTAGGGAGGSGSTAGKVPAQTSENMIEMQVKLNRMSASLRNARSQILALHGRLESLNLLNMDNVQAMMDRKVENITGMVNKLSSTCTTQRALQGAPQFILAPRDCSEYNVLEERKKRRVPRDPGRPQRHLRGPLRHGVLRQRLDRHPAEDQRLRQLQSHLARVQEGLRKPAG